VKGNLVFAFIFCKYAHFNPVQNEHNIHALCPNYECSFTIFLEILGAPILTHHHVAGTRLNVNLTPIFVVAFPLHEV
jgi:hypothetical protein